MVKKIFGISYYTGIGHDMAKRWFLRIKVPDYVQGGFKYKKCYGDINKHCTAAERLQAMAALAAEIEATQDYTTIKGSRKIGYINEQEHTSIVVQFSQCLEDRRPGLRLSTFRKYRGMVANLARWLAANNRAAMPVGAFTNIDAVAFLNSLLQQMSNESYNAHLFLFKSFFAQLLHKNIIAKNAFSGIKKLPAMSMAPLPFNRPQMEILKLTISAQDAQLWLFVQFIYYCFIRPGELRQLKICDINFYDGLLLVKPEISKNKKKQWVSIPAQLMQQVYAAGWQGRPGNDYIFGKHGVPGPVPLGVNSMKNRHQAILKSLNFSGAYKLYSWKHTGAVACARAGMPLKELQLQLRHHSLDQVNIYLQSMLVHESNFVKESFPSI